MRALEVTPTRWAQEVRELEQALRPSAVAGHLAAALSGPEAAAGAVRVLDVRYEPHERCTILYEVGDRQAMGILTWRMGPRLRNRSFSRIGHAWLRVHPFPADPALPGLATAMRPEEMAATLSRVLPGCQAGDWHLMRCRVVPVRYRPGRRCTLRLDAWARHSGTGLLGSHSLFGKVYQDEGKALSVFRLMGALSERAPWKTDHLAVAEPVAYLPDLPMVMQERMSGLPLDLLLRSVPVGPAVVDARGRQGVVAAARALAELHGLDVTHPRHRPIRDELHRVEGRCRAVAGLDPHLGGRMEQLVARLGETLDPFGPERREARVVHADCKPSQFLVEGSRVGILDFDHAGMGDPALDVGTFMASLRQLGCRRGLRAGRSGTPEGEGWTLPLEREFLDAYCATAGSDEDLRALAVWYQGFALLRKSLRAFSRSVRSPLPAMMVEEAERCSASMGTESRT